MEERRRPLETLEVVSFVLTAAMMLSSSLFFPSYYWLFILFAIVDGAATRLRSDLFLTLDRISYALIILVLGATAFGLAVLPMILETVFLIALIDFLFLVRQMRARSRADFSAIIRNRSRSYLITLVPAAVFSAGLSYVGALLIGTSIGPAKAILELGLASVAVFLIILFVAVRPTRIPD